MNHKEGDPNNCPFLAGNQQASAGQGTKNRDWWPNELKLNIFVQIVKTISEIWQRNVDFVDRYCVWSNFTENITNKYVLKHSK